MQLVGDQQIDAALLELARGPLHDDVGVVRGCHAVHDRADLQVAEVLAVAERGWRVPDDGEPDGVTST